MKAGLREADRAFLLGVLLRAARIDPASPDYARLKAVGQAAFAEDMELPKSAPVAPQETAQATPVPALSGASL